MRNPVSNLFISSINKLNSNHSHYMMKKLNDIGGFASLKEVTTGSEIKYLKPPSHARYCLDNLSKNKLVESGESGYRLSALGKLIMDQTERVPEIRNLRGVTRGSRYSNCNEERLLLTILYEGEKTREGLYDAVGGDIRRVTKSITNLMKKNLLRKSSYLHRYFKVEKNIDIGVLSTPEKEVYKLLSERDGEFTRGIDLYNDLKNTSYYSLGVSPLLKKGIISKKEKLLKYDLSVRGKVVANSLRKIADITNRIEPLGGRKLNFSEAFALVSKKLIT